MPSPNLTCMHQNPSIDPGSLQAYKGTGQHAEAKDAYYKSISSGPRDSVHTVHKEEGEISSAQQKGNASFQEVRSSVSPILVNFPLC